MPVGMAIASAINWARHIAATGDVKNWKGPQTVNPKSVGECVAALALWESMKAAAKADTSVPDGPALELAAQCMDAVELIADRSPSAVLLAWDEAKHPRHGKGSKGGGRFAAKGAGKGGGHITAEQTVTGGAAKKPSRSRARDFLRKLGGLGRSSATRKKLDERKEETGLTQLARRWNRLSQAERRKKMRELLAAGKKLPEGWSFTADGSIRSGK
jgi:hypothetical protein